MVSFKQRFSNIAKKISDSLGDEDTTAPRRAAQDSPTTSNTDTGTPVEVSFASAMARNVKAEEDATPVSASAPAVETVPAEAQHGEDAIAFLNFEQALAIADPQQIDSKVLVDISGTWDVYGYQDVDEDNVPVFQIILTPTGRGEMTDEFSQVFQRGMKREYALVRVSTLLLPSGNLLVGDEATSGLLNYETDVLSNPELSLKMTNAGLLFKPEVPEVGISELRNRDGEVHGVIISSEV